MSLMWLLAWSKVALWHSIQEGWNNRVCSGAQRCYLMLSPVEGVERAAEQHI
jgi:hypothetical protein